MKFLRITLTLLLLLAAFLTWMPWLNNKSIRNMVTLENGRNDGSVDENGQIICDYKVTIAPLGRWVASCEGGYYVSFWGKIF